MQFPWFLVFLVLAFSPLFSHPKNIANSFSFLVIKRKVGFWYNIILGLDRFLTLVFHCSSIIFSSFVATALAFGCFSGAALVAKRREYLYLGGLVSSGLSILMWLHFASAIFGGSMALFKFEVNNCQSSYFCGIIFKLSFHNAIRLFTQCLYPTFALIML